MNPKQGLDKQGTPTKDSMSKWTLPQPGSYHPETAPAKPQGGSRPAGANKTANTPSGTHGMVGSIKSRF